MSWSHADSSYHSEGARRDGGVGEAGAFAAFVQQAVRPPDRFALKLLEAVRIGDEIGVERCIADLRIRRQRVQQHFGINLDPNASPIKRPRRERAEIIKVLSAGTVALHAALAEVILDRVEQRVHDKFVNGGALDEELTRRITFAGSARTVAAYLVGAIRHNTNDDAAQRLAGDSIAGKVLAEADLHNAARGAVAALTEPQRSSVGQVGVVLESTATLAAQFGTVLPGLVVGYKQTPTIETVEKRLVESALVKSLPRLPGYWFDALRSAMVGCNDGCKSSDPEIVSASPHGVLFEYWGKDLKVFAEGHRNYAPIIPGVLGLKGPDAQLALLLDLSAVPTTVETERMSDDGAMTVETEQVRLDEVRVLPVAGCSGTFGGIDRILRWTADGCRRESVWGKGLQEAEEQIGQRRPPLDFGVTNIEAQPPTYEPCLRWADTGI